ncbi:MAG TPA: hypothetical protein VD996_09985 [Chitinophagaceae bacterium]|nr:hypothetical protein [Chitinophagaceae bacterium]
MKKSTSLLVLFFISLVSSGQTLTGSWYGRADVVMEGMHNNYLTELILKQKGDEVEGVLGYYFKNVYQSIFVRGTYNKRTRQVYIKNIPVMHYRTNSDFRLDCPMDFEGTLMVSKVKSSLQGYFLRHEKYKYTCPDIRVNYVLDAGEQNQDSILRNTIAGQKLWSPQPEDVVVNEQPAIVQSNKDSVITTVPVTNTEAETKSLLDRYAARKNNIQQEIMVKGDSLRISFYDNGDIDGDSISVFMNGTPIVTRKELDVRGLNLYVKLDSTKDVNELTMFAENLGKYPPNTALMVVFDGESRNEIYLSSSFTQNAAVRIRRKK